MARPIDEKIVAMKMDISDFKKKAAETTGLFGKLKTSLGDVGNTKGFSKIKDGLAGVQSAAQKVDMSTLGNAVDTVAQRFGGLEVIAATALATITNKAVNAGLGLAKSLGMDQITSGFSEYELKMGSIGTVLSNTEWDGTTLADVNKALGELNTYSDETIYNFAQMSQNVGRFTAAGVKLGDSTTAIKGLGNLAAISGSTTDQMNTAMYQMSQAMAAGKLNLMDWNSMTNAGMGGKKTQDALLATAKSMGIAVDTSEGFRNSIEQGWLTSEVFLATLKQFGDDESMTEAATKVRTFSQMMDTMKEGIGSGWAQSWEIIFGDFEEATKLWTGLSDFFGGFFEKQAKGRNALLKGIFDGGALGMIFSSLGNIAKPIVQIFSAIGAGFKAAFPPMGVKGILGLIEGFKKLTSGLKLSEKTVSAITSVFTGFFSIFALAGKVIAGAFGVIIGLLPSFSGVGAKIVELIGAVAGIPTAFNNSVNSAEAFSAVMEGLKKVASVVATGLIVIIGALVIFAQGVTQALNILLKGDFVSGGPWAEDSVIVDKLFRIREAVMDFVGAVVQAWNILVNGDYRSGGPWDEDSAIVDKLFKIREAVEEFVSGVVQAWNILINGDYRSGGPWDEDSAIVDKLFTIRETVEEFVGAVVQAWNILVNRDYTSGGPWDEDSGIVDKLFNIRESVEGMVKAVKDAWNDLISGFGGSKVSKVTGGFDKVKDSSKSVMDAIGNMNFSFDPLINGFNTVIDALKNGYSWIKDVFSGIGKFIKDSMPSGESLLSGGIVAAMVTIVGFVMKTVWDLKNMFLGWGEIGGSLSESLESIGGAFDSFSLQFKAQALLTASAAIVVFAVAVLMLSTVDMKDIGKALYAMIGSLGGLITAMAIMDKYDIEGSGMGAIVQIVAMSVAFSILAGAIKKLSDLSWEEMAKGLVGLIGVMGTFAGAIAIMGKFGGAKIGATSLQFLALATSMHILLSVVKKIAAVDTGDLVKGVSVMGIILAQLALFLKIAGASRFSVANTIGMLAVGQAIENMVKAIKQIADIDVGSLVKGLSVITIILAQITLFAKLTSGSDLLSSAAGMVLIAGALTLLLIPISVMGTMDMQTLAVGLGALAIALVAIGAASKLMTGMMAMGAGLALVAIGMTLLLIPITAFAAMSWEALLKGIGGLVLGLAALGGVALLLAPATAPLVAFGVALVLFGASVALLGAGLALAGLGMSLFATALVTVAAMTGTAIITIVSMLGTLILGLASLIPKATEFMMKVIHAIIDAISENAPLLYAKMLDMALNLLKVIEDKVPEFVQSASDIIVAFLEGIEAEVPRIIVTFANMMLSIAEAVEVVGPVVTNAFLRLMAEVTRIMVSAGVATIDALFGWIPGVSDITAKIGKSAEAGIVENFDSKMVADEKGMEFIDEMNAKMAEAEKAGKNVAESTKKGAETANLEPVAEDHGDDFISGIMSKVTKSNIAGVSMADATEDGADTANLTPIGTAHGDDFVKSIESKIGATKNAGTKLADNAEAGADTANLKPIGNEHGDDFANSLASRVGASKTAGTKIADSAEAGANTGNFKPIGTTDGNEYASSLSSRVSASRTAGVNLANAGKNGASSVSMTSSGANFAQGFARGMSQHMQTVRNMATALARTAKNGVTNFLQIQSPSRLMMKDGGFFAQGFADGIFNKTKRVGAVARKLASTAKDAVNEFIDGFELPDEENELHFKAVVDYEALDVNKFGKLRKVVVKPESAYSRQLAERLQPVRSIQPVPDAKTTKPTTDNSQTNHVTLNYSGSGGEEDAMNMVKLIEQELGSRAALALAMRGE